MRLDASAGANLTVYQSLRCQFLVGEKDRISGNTERLGKLPGGWHRNTGFQPAEKYDLTQALK